MTSSSTFPPSTSSAGSRLRTTSGPNPGDQSVAASPASAAEALHYSAPVPPDRQPTRGNGADHRPPAPIALDPDALSGLGNVRLPPDPVRLRLGMPFVSADVRCASREDIYSGGVDRRPQVEAGADGRTTGLKTKVRGRRQEEGVGGG